MVANMPTLSLVLSGCSRDEAGGTERMVKRLEQMVQNTNPETNLTTHAPKNSI